MNRRSLLASASALAGLAVASAALANITLTGAGKRSAGGGAVVPGSLLTTLPTTPQARWHPAFSTVVLDGSGRVSTATDLMGLADLSATRTGAELTDNGSLAGPLELTDALGRKFWRFTGLAVPGGTQDMLRWADALGMNTRSCAFFFIGRWHQGVGTIASPGTQAVSNTIGGAMRCATPTNGNVPYLTGFDIVTQTVDTTNAKYMAAGCQMQMLATVSRSANATRVTPDKNQLLYINNTRAQVTAVNSVTGLVGGEIGHYVFAGANTAYGSFDLYELVAYNVELTDAQADATAAALCTNWDFPALTNNAFLDGDSLTGYNFSTSIAPFNSPAMAISTPGAAYAMDNTWRVLDLGASGNMVSHAVTRRDVVAGWPSLALSGRNVWAGQIGVNDLAAAGTAATVYAAVVALLNTATTGILQRGWECRLALNIANGNGTVQGKIDTLRGTGTNGYRNAQFLIDCLADPGNTFAGKLGLIRPDTITVSGTTVFDTSANALTGTYYVGGTLHESPAGAILFISGGDVPAIGYRQRILDAV